jgi:hypothetical protein
VETSGVYIPTGFGSFDKYDRSLFWGTLHPHPFILVKLVMIKSGESPWSSGLKGGRFGGCPLSRLKAYMFMLFLEKSLKLCLNIIYKIIKVGQEMHVKYNLKKGY